jgi:hypothetical protein
MYRRLIALAALVVTSGCWVPPVPKTGPPPIEFSFRKSQVLAHGMVAGLRNASTSETLAGIVVTVRSPKEQGVRSHVVDKAIRPQDTVTIGWIELDGWKLKPGDEVAVKCTEYPESKTVTVPEH